MASRGVILVYIAVRVYIAVTDAQRSTSAVAVFVAVTVAFAIRGIMAYSLQQPQKIACRSLKK